MLRHSLPRLAQSSGALVAALWLLPSSLGAQAADTTATPAPIELHPITVTATRQARDVFAVPTPVIVLDSADLRRKAPNGAADLFRDQPGLDVNGVGPNQTRPTIRGQQGQRILLLEDGVRLNNSRRQQDFGELPALVDVSGIQKIEVVRGPASVLYGSDAIGGVVNLVTRSPEYGMAGSQAHGHFGYRYSSAGDLQKGEASLYGHSGNLGFMLGGTLRDADSYKAPAGSYGKVTLPTDTLVNDAGVKDWSARAYLGYRFGGGHGVFGVYERYRADNAGFGFIDPNLFGPGQPSIQIRYPRQDYDKYTLGYNSPAIHSLLANRVNLIGYTQRNKRRLQFGLVAPAGPGASVAVNSDNFTNLGTVGFRAEATKLVQRHVLTYGVDFFRDHSDNTDSSLTVLVGFGPPPPITIVSTRPNVPNASFRSAGVFLQSELHLLERASLILGGRYQTVTSETRTTQGLTAPLVDHTDQTVVGSASAIYGITEHFNLVAGVGRGFRSPNLVERFFDGQAPEVPGGAYQIRNPALKPETSLNLDLGFKWRQRRAYVEGFVFQNSIHDGIRIAATGGTFPPGPGGLPAYQNVNIDKLRYRGVELAGDVALVGGLSAGANYTYVKSKDVLKPNNPIGSTYSSKIDFALRYRHSNNRFWAEYALRHNGKQKDIPVGSSPVGDTLPAFTVHTVRGGLLLFSVGRFRQELAITVANLTNELYAESANAGFFRPEPRRNVTVSWNSSF